MGNYYFFGKKLMQKKKKKEKKEGKERKEGFSLLGKHAFIEGPRLSGGGWVTWILDL
jgi:hypothetical protein